MTNHNITGLDHLHEKRLLGALKQLVELLREHNEGKWADRFEEDAINYQEALKPANYQRQLAVIEHIYMAYTGMFDIRDLELGDEESTERLNQLVIHVWQASRGLQSTLIDIINS